jgi:hypothetical protein
LPTSDLWKRRPFFCAQADQTVFVWIEPKNLKKDIALAGVFDNLHVRFPK